MEHLKDTHTSMPVGIYSEDTAEMAKFAIYDLLLESSRWSALSTVSRVKFQGNAFLWPQKSNFLAGNNVQISKEIKLYTVKVDSKAA